jgi:cytochrome P450
MMGALNQRAIARMEPAWWRSSTACSIARRRAAADLIEDFAAQIPVEVIGNLLDVPRAERGPLRAWSLAILSALEPCPAPSAGARPCRGERLSRLPAHAGGAAPRTPGRPGGRRADAADPGRVRRRAPHETELLHNCIFLLNAGHETTTNLIGNGVHALLAQRSQLERLQREPALINSAVEELLRFESPLQLNNRSSPRRSRFGTRELPAGDFVTLASARRTATRRSSPPRHARHRAQAQPARGVRPWRTRLCRHERGPPRGAHRHRRAGGALSRLDAAGPAQRDRRVRFRGFVHLPVRL